MSPLGTQAAELWLKQFRDPADQELAKLLLSSFTLVTHSEFDRQLTNALAKLARDDVTAVFIEREISKRKVISRRKYTVKKTLPSAQAGKIQAYASHATAPTRMYKQRKVKVPGRRKRAKRAEGAALAPVDASRRDEQRIGSEGTVAAIASRAAKNCLGRLLVHPAASTVRTKKVRHIVIVTDIIGSGDRISSMLDSLWRVCSVRSWHSTKLIRFSVLAYCATSKGRKAVRRHPSGASIITISKCPTIKNSFLGNKVNAIRNLCKKHWHDPARSLGYGRTEALIAFEHSCPNNVPAMFCERRKSKRDPWYPLFPARTTRVMFDQHTSISKSDCETLALEALQFRSIAESKKFRKSSDEKRNMIVLLAALHRGRRDIIDLMTATGLTIQEAGTALAAARFESYADANNRLSRHGQQLLLQLSREAPRHASAVTPKLSYYPTQLRSPVSQV